MNDLEMKRRLLVLAYIERTEPVPYALLVTLILSGLSMDYFEFHEALSSIVDAGLARVDLDESPDASGKPRSRYLLSDQGRTVLNQLRHQIAPPAQRWLDDNALHYVRDYYENDLFGASYRAVDGGFMVSLGQTKDGKFLANYTFLVECESDAKKAIDRFKNAADGLHTYLRTSLIDD